LILLNRHTLFLPLVPVPLVDLALAETELLGDATAILAGPVWILFEFILKNLQLLLILSLTALDVAARSIAILRLLQQRSHAIVEVSVLKSVVGDVKELSEFLVVLGGTSEHVGVSLSCHDIIFFGFSLRVSSFMLVDHHRLVSKVRAPSGARGISAQAMLVGGAVMCALLDFLAMVLGKRFSIGRRGRVGHVGLKLSCRRDGNWLLYLLFVLLKAHVKLCSGWHLS
jgi:hypothetical protein